MSDMRTSLLELLVALCHFFDLLSLLGEGEESERECFLRIFVLAICRSSPLSEGEESELRPLWPLEEGLLLLFWGRGASFPTVLLVPVTPVHNLMVGSSVISRILLACFLKF